MSLFYCCFEICFKISFKLLKKFVIDETSDNIFEVYFVITPTSSDLDKPLNLNSNFYYFQKISKTNERTSFKCQNIHVSNALILTS